MKKKKLIATVLSASMLVGLAGRLRQQHRSG